MRIIARLPRAGHRVRRRLLRGRPRRAARAHGRRGLADRPRAVARELPPHRPHPRGGAKQRAPTPSIPATASWPRTRTSRAPARRPASSSSARAARRSRSWARRPRPAALAVGRACRWCRARCEPVEDSPRSRREAERIGFPVMLKAAAGGGGKGLRLVEDARARWPPPPSARAREAQSAFGDGRVYLEKALLRPRHIEIQVLADQHGNVVHLFERECSIQRRHQKVDRGEPVALRHPGAARAHGRPGRGPRRSRRGYLNAGTLEFLVDAGPQSLLPRDEHAPAGRAPGDGDGHRPRPREAADPRSRRASRCRSRRTTCASAATPSSAASTPRTPSAASCPAPGGSSPCARPAGPACATTAACTKATRSRSTTTR